ncbi:hypothetical protein OB2597_18686 [Pseudooceanicola batsensis HTCC2597]|uniref:Uncharacterized protein n=1 Tax=Pseudooceanicola batsensis (strain ATCC BAA-863 / DSM 15984 / KCTC 12145 / HTCC2597) TaxID=252305 RepID=A3U3I2_PSEBH|nr:hypothetical protein OB2597_18686 [Pseudooceanicola batsensis HTCC2597]
MSGVWMLQRFIHIPNDSGGNPSFQKHRLKFEGVMLHQAL